MLFAKVAFLLLLFSQSTTTENVNLGLVFEHTNADIAKVFEKAIEVMNSEGNDVTFSGVSVNVTYGNAFEMSKKLCKMLKSSIAAVFGPETSIPATHAISICDAKEVPYFDTRWDFNSKLAVVNLHPHPSQIALALKDLVVSYGWSGFTILYETGSYLSIVNELLQLYGHNGPTITVRKYELDLNKNYKNVLRKIKMSGDRSIVISGSTESLPGLLEQAQQVGLLTDSYQYIVANLDFHTIDLEPFQYADTNITSFRIISPEDPRVVEVLKHLYGPDEDVFRNVSCPMTVNMGLIYDGVLLLAETYKHITYAPTQLNCNDDNTWDKGFTLVNYLKSISLNGLSGEIKFDHQGLRTDFQLEIIELASSGITKVGSWKPQDGLVVQRNAVPFSLDADSRSLANKSFIVITALSDPYGMLKESPTKLSGNDQYEGFGIELIQELGKKLGFNYTFLLQEDNVYGSLNPETGEWNGMLKEVLENRADMAITDLTMTSDRESAVDFTIPFMNLGIAILYKKPTKEPPKLFSFMSPFSGQVWLYLGVAYFSVSLSLFILGRLSPTEWDNPYPCIEEPTELENQFSFANSLWFTMGALLQQGSEIAPKSPSTRTVASIWWFFTLIMVSSYTANLAAFLTVESLSSPIESAEDLANGKGGVKYGAKRGGSTFNFFKDAKYPPYVKMYEFMKEHPEYCPSSNADGVNKVEKDNYAFLMESTSIEYIIERKCSLTQVGSLLDEKGYGIAMRKNWPYRDALSQAVLELQEQGILTKMKTKWWKEKRGGGTCSDSAGDGGAVALELANLGGVFVVLIIGSFFAVFFSILEMMIDVKRRSTESKSSFKAELIDELKFIMKCSGNTKEIKHSKGDLSVSSNSTVSIDSIESNNPDEVKLRNRADQMTLTY